MHTDHLNTPRLVADATGTTVWRWGQAEPFGVNAPDENPSALGAFDLPLRLPGQRYDAETGLHYNYFRDYDASLGLYKQFDPIGLRGGTNGYAYAFDPLTQVDPAGLMGRGPAGSSRPMSRSTNFCGARFKYPNYAFTVGVNVSFNGACETHDACYARCKASKIGCDQNFFYDMLNACGSVPMGSFNYFICRQQAFYYQAATLILGDDAFNDAQKICKGC